MRSMSEPSTTASEKGKSKVEDSEVCGICLYSSSNGDAISRGYIDSCDHYFCFVCIMEWSKIESKCPICKRRFSLIRRPPKSGVFSRERRVSVPLRDQVYYHFGNASVGPPNLYSETKCSVCHSGGDENLLLLCDLCDIASHSYCIGLGATVPEGDWFCTHCAVLKKAEHTTNETPDETDVQSSDKKLKFASSHVSTSHNSQSSSSCTFPCHNLDGEDIGGTNKRNEVSPRRQSRVLSREPMINARTLVRCRNVHDRIRALRANWNNIRNGSVSFTSTTVDQSSTLQEPVVGSSSGETETSIAHGGASNMSHRSSSHEINRAWKMMGLAMTIGQNRKRSMPQTSHCPLKKIKSSKDVTSPHLSVSHKSSNKDLGSITPRTPQQGQSLANKNRCVTQILGRRSKSNERMISALPGVMSSKEMDCSPRRDGSMGETVISLDRRFSRSPLIAKSDVGASCNSTISPSLSANVLHVNPQSDASPSLDKRGNLSYRGVVDKKCGKDKLVNSQNDAKSEIQSLVKLNLKILTKDQKLEDDAFKQVARTATHSIVAACELEHPKTGRQHFPSSICCHTNDIQQQRRSSLMPNSCRKCFYAFVKDVVSNLLNDKRIHRNKA